MSRRRLARSLALLMTTAAAAEPPDLRHEEFLEQLAATYGFSLGEPRALRATPGGEALLFLRSGPRSFVRDLYELDLETGEETRLASAAMLLEGEAVQVSAEEQARRERMRLAAKGIAQFELSRDGRRVLVPLSGRLFLLERATRAVRELPGGAPALDARFSPDGNFVACVRDGDLHVMDLEAGTQRRLTTRRDEHLTNGLAEFVAQEEMGRMQGYWWSPDSRHLAYQETDTSGLPTYHLADPMDPTQPPHAWPYPRAGTKNAAVRLGVIPRGGGETVWVDRDREAFEYLASVTWEPDAPLTLLVQDRAQQREQLLAVDPATGACELLLEERDEAWLELFPGTPAWLPGGGGFLWVSETSGAPALELRGPDGGLRRILTPPALGFRHLLRVLGGEVPGGRGPAALVSAGADPTETQLWVVHLNGDPATPVTTGRGVHRGSRQPRTPVFTVHSSWPDGRQELAVYRGGVRLAVAPRSLAEEPSLQAGVEWVLLEGEPTLHAALVRPRDFRVGRRYPVLVHVYGGPTHRMVQAAGRGFLNDQWLADQGFVVVRVDGRGTPGRGRTWHRAARGDYLRYALEDTVAGVRRLAARFPELDATRVGIHGWSFGGYLSAYAAMRRPDVFAAAMAGAPVVDSADYDTHYTERYLGLPGEAPGSYRAVDLLTYAADLERPLLLVHGTTDDNVYFQHSLKLANALFREGRHFEFLPLSGFTHMVPDPLVKRRLWGRVVGFFRRHLGEPRGG